MNVVVRDVLGMSSVSAQSSSKDVLFEVTLGEYFGK